MVPIVVPQSSPIDARMPEQERAAEALIEEARLQIGNRLQARWVKVRAGQFGRIVVEDARITKARAIVMSIPPKAGSGSIYRSIDTVMAERPCRVILQADPQARTVKQLQEIRS
jgi:APA family basic amino acid/polyamine antiporter